MAKKTTRKPRKTEAVNDPKSALLSAAMDLAEKMGWGHVMLSDLARESGLGLAYIYELIDDKSDILVLLGRSIDKKVLAQSSEPDPTLSARERLFDILMNRFDALNNHRAAIVSILESFRTDPKQLVISCPHLGRSMSWMLEAAGIETDGLRGALRVAGLTAVYLKTLRVWKEDESKDLSRVMAALDKDLGRVEKLADRLGF